MVGAIYILLGVGAVWLVHRAVQDRRRLRRRRETLHRDDDGYYIWMDLDGTERRSRSDPDAVYTGWRSGGDDDGGFDGGGFDGGGDGGGDGGD